MRRTLCSAAGCAVLFASLPALAGDVELRLEIHANGWNTWALTAAVGDDAPGGLAGYAVQLADFDGTVLHLAPVATLEPDAAIVGLGLFRSGDGERLVSAFQDSFSSGGIAVADLGRVPGDLASFGTLASATQPQYDAPLLLAAGEFTGPPPSFDQATPAAVNLFNPDSASGTVAGDVTLAEAGSGCVADWDGDGLVRAADLVAYVGSFRSGSVRADLDSDGGVTARDVVRYVRSFRLGCSD